MKTKPRIPVVVGPTAVGKSFVAMEFARRSGAEIVSADARQVYRYMDIGTAKPSSADLGEIVHHFIDIIDPDQSYNAGQYGVDARLTIRSLISKNKPIIVVGGSGLYVRSLIEGLFEGVGKDEDLRQRIRGRIEQEGLNAVYAYLKAIDPDSATRIHPHDRKRIERAVEVYETTGRPLSKLQDSPPINLDFEPCLIGLECERSVLYRRIEDRVDAMIKAGVIEETEGLLARGYAENLVSMESLGYREIIAFLKGELSRERTVERFKQASRNYAKRQLTWFRKDQRIHWHSATNNTELELAAAELFKEFVEK